MPEERVVRVHLTPDRLTPALLAQSVAVVIDVLRATTTMIHALASGCVAVWPVAEVEEARRIADGMRAGRVLLGGERDGVPPAGFDLGNSPGEYTCARCKGTTLVLTTTNGTGALLRAAPSANSWCRRHVLLISSAPAITATSPWKTPCWPERWSSFCASMGRSRSTTPLAWPGTASSIMAACSTGRWKSAPAALTCAAWAMRRTFTRRRASISSLSCRKCAASRCASKSARWALSRVIG
jgi:hypothetical protein